MLGAFMKLAEENQPHPCGGFTTDDVQWRLGIAFTPREELHAALDELQAAQFIRHAGEDEADAIGLCYEAVVSPRPVKSLGLRYSR